MLHPTFSPHSPVGRGRRFTAATNTSQLPIVPSPPRGHFPSSQQNPSHGASQVRFSAVVRGSPSQGRAHPPPSPSVVRSCPARISTSREGSLNLSGHGEPHSTKSPSVQRHKIVEHLDGYLQGQEGLTAVQSSLTNYLEAAISAFEKRRDFAAVRRLYPAIKAILTELTKTSSSSQSRELHGSRRALSDDRQHSVMIELVSLAVFGHQSAAQLQPFVDLSLALYHSVSRVAVACILGSCTDDEGLSTDIGSMVSPLLRGLVECFEHSATHIEVCKEIDEVSAKAAPVWATAAEEAISLLRHLQHAAQQLFQQVQKWHKSQHNRNLSQKINIISFLTHTIPTASETIFAQLDIAHLLSRSGDQLGGSLRGSITNILSSADTSINLLSATTVPTALEDKNVCANYQASTESRLPPPPEQKAMLMVFHSFTDTIRYLQHQLTQHQQSVAGMGELLVRALEQGAVADGVTSDPLRDLLRNAILVAGTEENGQSSEQTEVASIPPSRVVDINDEDKEEPWVTDNEEEEEVDQTAKQINNDVGAPDASQSPEAAAEDVNDNALETALADLATTSAEASIALQFSVTLTREAFIDELTAMFKPTSKFVKALAWDGKSHVSTTQGEPSNSKNEGESAREKIVARLSAPQTDVSASPRRGSDEEGNHALGATIAPLLIAPITMSVEGQEGVDAWPYLGLSTDVIGRYCKEVATYGVLRRTINDLDSTNNQKDFSSSNHLFAFLLLVIRSTVFDRKAFDLPLPYAVLKYVLEMMLIHRDNVGSLTKGSEQQLFALVRPFLRTAAYALDAVYCKNVIEFAEADDGEDRELSIDKTLYEYVVTSRQEALTTLRVHLYRIITTLAPFTFMPLPVSAGLVMAAMQICCVDAPLSADAFLVGEEAEKQRLSTLSEHILRNLDFSNNSWKADAKDGPSPTPGFLKTWVSENAIATGESHLAVSERRLRSFLRLCTSLAAIPLTGLPKHIDVVCRDELFESEKEPASSITNRRLGIFGRTCFYELVLPKYESYEDLKDALNEVCDNISYNPNDTAGEGPTDIRATSDNSNGWDMGEIHI